MRPYMDDHVFQCFVCGGLFTHGQLNHRFEERLCDCCTKWNDEQHWNHFKQEAEQAAHDYWLTTQGS